LASSDLDVRINEIKKIGQDMKIKEIIYFLRKKNYNEIKIVL